MAVFETRQNNIVLKGIGVSPGIVTGRAYVLDYTDVQIPHYHLKTASQASEEARRFRKAIRESKNQLLSIRKALTEEQGLDPLFILDIHMMMLKDRSLIHNTLQNIREKGVNAEWALRMTVDRYRQAFNKIEDSYLKERISDVEYVEQRLLRNLVGKKKETISEIQDNVIIISRDLSPADTVQMKMERILGFATDIGGKTSHTAIVARSIGIPAVVGLERITHEVRNDDTVIVDGCDGFVIINPDPEILKRYEEKRRHFHQLEQSLLKEAKLPAITLDGHRVEIGANIEFVEEIPSAIEHGADGVGLYRTEFIFINREKLPTEREHFLNYVRVIEGKGMKWSTIRTFDLGGDKFVSDAKLAKELNPVMGLRAIRFCLQEIELFKVQLRAILRASAFGKTRVLFPMISGVEEIRQVKKILQEVKKELEDENVPIGSDIEIGIMIEVPSAVLVAGALAREVDFFSIGTNDLIQYTLAIDRINESVSYLYEPLHPAVLKMLRMIVEEGRQAGIRVAMCGEMAGEPAYALILLGLEINELSMHPMAIPRVKKVIRGATCAESKSLLEKVIKMSSAAEIEDYVRKYMASRFPENGAEEKERECIAEEK
ncbi:MAG: phosphoenolpyruvate--protein phosphotransferase [Syntrophales bacterium]|nr:phosphoenolpyruvate--protein phosphotransferase [Syntrophales bacterium]MDD5233933.1 phosphoenolpyruvate--protein phosphotransferase [Syntrophales bacterium]HPL63358.1 phosphoenolpyruvate--protein phosphotransferase [Syntrophales bacterium]